MTLTSFNLQNPKTKHLTTIERIQVAAWMAGNSTENYIYSYIDLGVSEKAYQTHINRLHKFERKCMSGSSVICVSDFAIPVSELPEQHIELMRLLGWINAIGGLTKAKGFCKESRSGLLIGETHTCNFITVDKYAELLVLEATLLNYADGLNGGRYE